MNKNEMLHALSDKISECQRCPKLVENRTQTVFADGNPDSEVVFIGEAPGRDEDTQGVPFVGRAGKLLDSILEACGFSRENVYICNIVKCRPPSNRNPESEEAQNCRPYLNLQLKLINPKYIVCLGAVAAQNLLGVDTPIGRMRGRWHEYNGTKVLCTYHPAYLLRNPNDKKKVWDDLQLLLGDLNGTQNV
jgi:DNA polymerase